MDTANLALEAQLGFAPSSINDYAADFKNFKVNLKKAIESGVVDSRYRIEDGTLSLEDDAKTYLKNNSNYKTATFSGVIADIVNGLMAIPNLIALLALSPIIIKETKHYFDNH